MINDLGIAILCKAVSTERVIAQPEFKDYTVCYSSTELSAVLHAHNEVLLAIDIAEGANLTMWIDLLSKLQPNPELVKKRVVVATKHEIGFVINHLCDLGLNDHVEFHQYVDVTSFKVKGL